MDTRNLWPDFTIDKIRSPKTILQEQADFLKDRTKGIVYGKVVTQTLTDNTISHIFRIIAPKIGHYAYDLFAVYNNAELYPVNLNVFDEDELVSKLSSVLDIGKDKYGFDAHNEEEFTLALSTIFRADTTKRVIQNLYSLSLD